jgi:histidinol-phosphate aminotransferase
MFAASGAGVTADGFRRPAPAAAPMCSRNTTGGCSVSTFDDLANPWVKSLAIYEPGRPIEDVARELGFANEEYITKLASNENALGPSPLALKAMRDAAEAMHRYPDGGAFYFRQALAAKLGVAPGQILAGNGSNELIELLGHAFLSPETGIVMADRAFVVYKLVASLFQAETVMVPMKDFTHDLDAMLAAIRPNTRIVYISNPNNPTSTLVGQDEIDRFMDRVPPHVVVCFDEAYIELLPPDMRPDVLRFVRDGRNVVTLRTMSKTYGLAGLRIGYAVAPPECIRLLDRVRQPFNVNAMALAAASAALQNDEHVERTCQMVQEGIAFLQSEFARMGLRYVPAVANFILVEVGRGRQVFESMMREGVIVRPMDGYGLPQHVRVTVGTRRENEKCLDALRVVLAVKAGNLTS